jgi:DNA-directed RNA polymerase specialized sigma24 family protein
MIVNRINFMNDRSPFQAGGPFLTCMPHDEPLIKALQAQNVAAFKTVVIDYSGDMVLFASRLLQDPVRANDTVNDLLLDLYNSAFRNATSPLRAFLFEKIRLACHIDTPL